MLGLGKSQWVKVCMVLQVNDHILPISCKREHSNYSMGRSQKIPEDQINIRTEKGWLCICYPENVTTSLM